MALCPLLPPISPPPLLPIVSSSLSLPSSLAPRLSSPHHSLQLRPHFLPSLEAPCSISPIPSDFLPRLLRPCGLSSHPARGFLTDLDSPLPGPRGSVSHTAHQVGASPSTRIVEALGHRSLFPGGCGAAAGTGASKKAPSASRFLGFEERAFGLRETCPMEEARVVQGLTAAVTREGEEIGNYADIATLPIAAALAASGSETGDFTGISCSLLDKSEKKRVCLFYCNETEELARRIAAESDTIELKTINWRTFADGFPNLFVPNAHGIRSQHVAFLASFSSPAVIFEQLSVIYALPRMFVSSFTLVLPFFPTGTFERMEDEGDIATAFTLARILSNIPISRGGPTSLVIFDIHALQERFYFGDNVLPCFESGIPLLKHRLHQLPDSNNVVIAFPDEGAWKRFHNQLQHFPTVICTKVREGDKRIVRLKEGDPAGRHVVIVDDLVQSGGTLIECQKVLSAHGAAKVSAFATHGVFPKRSWEKFIQKEGEFSEQGFTHFWISDSCPLTVKEVMGKAPFEVLSLAGSIAAALHI